jgi:hypothetical protein
MNATDGSLVTPLLQRSLSAVYRFYDAFYFPIDKFTQPIASPLDVSIPALRWSASRAETDFSYRFSTLTLTQPAPSGANLAVEVVSTDGDYVSFEQIVLTLPLALSSPPKPADFLIVRPLWPTVAFRPPGGETAVRGQIRSAAALPVAGLKIVMWPGAAVTPPAGTPFTRSNANGEFLFRFPLLKSAGGSPFHIRLNDGAIGVSPASPSVVFGRTQMIQFQRI